MMKYIKISVLGLTFACFSGCSEVSSEIPALNLNTEQITLSGLSSGGFMATQMHVAYADWVAGAGIVAAGPYFCARNSLQTAIQECLTQQDIDVDLAKIEAQRRAWQEAGKVAPIEEMQKDRVWILHGTKDTRLSRKVASALYRQYQSWVDNSHISFNMEQPFAHHFPTVSQGSECGTSKAPFLGQCNFDTAGAILSHILPDIREPEDAASGELLAFNQHHIAGDAGDSLAETGYLYIPPSCASGESCQVHISFHGCNQFADADGVNNQYARAAGFNRWADTNNLVVLYPQTQASAIRPFNPQGCWDWWGYSGADYANREGVQLIAIQKMVMYFAGVTDEQ